VGTLSVEIDYILEEDALRQACRRRGLLTDYAFSEWEMLMRLRVGDVEVFGRSDEDYQVWLETLRRNNLPLDIPSPAWSRLSVLWIATGIEVAFTHLGEKGYGDLGSLDCAIRLARQDDTVTVSLGDRVGQAPMVELYVAFAGFAEQVRHDFLAICPRLADHVTLGPWFRREDTPPVEPLPAILL